MHCASDQYMFRFFYYIYRVQLFAYYRFIFNFKLIQLDRGRIQWPCRMSEQRMQRRKDQNRKERAASWYLG